MSDLLLLSGGIDSVALAAWLRPAVALTVDYGQRAAEAEIKSSRQVCLDLGLRHVVVRADVSGLGAGDMSFAASSRHSAHSEFWPFRNQFLLTIGAMSAIQHQCGRVLIGTVATDVRHRDGSSVFLDLMDQVVVLQEGGIRVVAPAASFTSAELVSISAIPPSVLGWAHSCHVGGLACGTCRGCQKHSEVMGSLGWRR